MKQTNQNAKEKSILVPYVVEIFYIAWNTTFPSIDLVNQNNLS